MGTLRFSDGWNVDTSGPYRVIYGPDGWYVVGRGMLVPVDSFAEGAEELLRLHEQDVAALYGPENDHPEVP